VTQQELASGSPQHAQWLRAFGPGRMARGLIAWLLAGAFAVSLGASLTVVFAIVRETVLHPPLPVSDWWIFTNLWRPLLIAGGILVPVFSGPLAALSVWLIRRNGWPRPLADVLAGAGCGLGALAILVLVARTLGPTGA
jgi:hypothetical protein